MVGRVLAWGSLIVFAGLPLGGCGEPQPVGGAPSGIVSMGPHLTEAIFALGQGDRLVGVCTYCDYPPEVAELPRLGAYLNPDVEKLSILRPELIIAPGKHEKLTEFAKMAQLNILNIHMDSFETIDTGIAALAKALDCVEAGEELRARVKRELDDVRRAVAAYPRPKVLIVSTRFEHDLNTLFTVGRDSFVSEIVEAAGGDNVFADETQAYFEASKESVVMRAPDVILEFHAGENLSEEDQARYKADWNALASLPAVKNGRVHLFLDGHGLRPGPRVALTARKIAAMLHPDGDFAQP